MEIVTLPRLGQTMESGVIARWYFEVGEAFTEGSPLYEVETDKITSDVEARMDGVLLRVLASDGEEVPVGSALAIIGSPGEIVSDAAVAAALAGTGADMSGSQVPTPESVDSAVASVSPPPVDASDASRAEPGAILAVPKARDLARRRGVDLAEIAGTGADGVIRVVDVLSSTRGPAAAHAVSVDATSLPVSTPSSIASNGTEIAARVPLRGIRRAMSEALSASWPRVPQFTQQVTVNATALKARLARLKYEGNSVTYNDLMVAAVAQLALKHPDVNASFRGDEIVYFAGVNVSVAVATDDGLVVPVIHNAHRLSVPEIAARARELAERGRNRSLVAEDMGDGTITVSNLGAMGIESGTAIVNAPQSAIVFVGAVREVPVVANGQIVILPQLGLSVSFDHRVVDGMTAAKFTVELKERLENGG